MMTFSTCLSVKHVPSNIWLNLNYRFSSNIPSLYINLKRLAGTASKATVNSLRVNEVPHVDLLLLRVLIEFLPFLI